ncbi:MAG: RDD family protein [Bacillota bacterium]
MRRILEILTPENVFVEYELAGLGSRFIAFLIDCIIQFILVGIAAVTVFLAGFDIPYVIADLGIFNFVAFIVTLIMLFHILYFVFFEMILKGQSPGKKVMRLRVIKQNGQPINIFDSFLRGILRFADFLPSYYLVGSIFVIISKNYKRIGDFAANTIVVKVKNQEQLVTVDNLLNKAVTMESQEYEGVNVYPVNNIEYNVLKEFLSRKDNLGEKRPQLAFNLNTYFMKKFNLEKPYDNPYDFFEEIIKMNSGV